MKQQYVVAKIKQVDRELSILENYSIVYQHSENLYIELVMDDSIENPFNDMLVTCTARFSNTDTVETCPIIKDSGHTYITLVDRILNRKGMIYISIGGINEQHIVITSNVLKLDILDSNPIISTIAPPENYWQIEVKNAIEHWYATIIKPQLDANQEEIDNLIVEAKNQQETVTTQQSTLDAVIELIQSKITNGDFVPKHKWVGDVLYFSNEDGTWDEGFKVPGLDALNWKVATCVENATYEASIENWGTTVNSLLAITFDTALDNTKEVILKINDEQAYPILSNNKPILGEELENKSTILRFDGTNWLVQTSQSGTVQSSDKSVKDIVTVTKEELKQLQEEGLLVEGTLYQTIENPIDVTPLENEVLELKENLSNPNLLINGDFQVWQRGEEFTINSSLAYTADRWRVKSTATTGGSDVIISKLDNGMSIQGSEYSHISQFVEGNMLNKTVSFSMKIDGIVLKSENISISEIVESKKFDNITVTILYYPDRRATYISVDIKDSLKHNIEWVKLEYGSFVTPFVPRLYGEELALCQRYFQRHMDFAVRMCRRNSATHNYVYYLPVTMRSNPTITISNDTFIISVNSEILHNSPINDYYFITTQNYVFMVKNSTFTQDSMINFGRMDIDSEIY